MEITNIQATKSVKRNKLDENKATKIKIMKILDN